MASKRLGVAFKGSKKCGLLCFGEHLRRPYELRSHIASFNVDRGYESHYYQVFAGVAAVVL